MAANYTNDNWFSRYLYYGLIFVLSLITLFFLPMLGSEAGLDFDIPNTPIGWVVWSVSNLTAAILNVLMFHCFIKQGKQNILEHPSYLEANNLLLINRIMDIVLPRSPKTWHSQQYRRKGIMLFLFTILGTISFGQAILTFNLVKFLSQAIVLLTGLIFGFMQMKSTEEYWTVEYLAYAKYMVQEKEKEEEAAQTTNYLEITTTSTIERTREIPIKEETNNNVSTQ